LGTKYSSQLHRKQYKNKIVKNNFKQSFMTLCSMYTIKIYTQTVDTRSTYIVLAKKFQTLFPVAYLKIKTNPHPTVLVYIAISLGK